MNIPRVMSTQHPDNISLPFFAQKPEMGDEDELQEAYYAYSHLGCDDQMWDHEGKEVDSFIVRKLVTRYESYFRVKVLGEDHRLTLRVPNPDYEKTEAKVLIETLESIPRSTDAASLFYGRKVAPVFEVILPMTTSAASLNRVYHYYRDFVVGKQRKPFFPGDITIAQWVGESAPDRINVIPLFEDKSNMLKADEIVREYLKDKDVTEQRVFLARSDPAMNYGMLGAVLMNKIALYRLQQVQDDLGTAIYPILGTGSCPFRGHFSPDNVQALLDEYPSVQTYTAQSAFKYDYPAESVIAAIQKLKDTPRGRATGIDEEKAIYVSDKVAEGYRAMVEQLAPFINQVAAFVPRRRMRRLHVGLFGYARSIGKTRLPRAIGFTAATYSIGLPPELFGLGNLSRDEIEWARQTWGNFDRAISSAMSCFNPAVLEIIPKEVRDCLPLDLVDYTTNEEHREATNGIVKSLTSCDFSNMQVLVTEAARARKFLG